MSLKVGQARRDDATGGRRGDRGKLGAVASITSTASLPSTTYALTIRMFARRARVPRGPGRRIAGGKALARRLLHRVGCVAARIGLFPRARRRVGALRCLRVHGSVTTPHSGTIAVPSISTLARRSSRPATTTTDIAG